MQVGRLGGLGITATQKKNKAALEKSNQRLSSVLERLSTGKSINRASDDAAGLSISEQLNSQIRGFKSAGRNVQDAMSALNISDGASGSVTELVQRQRELASQARNGTVNDEQRKILNQEYQQLTDEVNRIAESTQFNRKKVANGSEFGDGTAEIQVGADAGQVIAMPTVDLRSDTLGTTTTDISTIAGAEAAMSIADDAIGIISEQRSSIGSMTNRLTSTSNNLTTAAINTEAADSLIRDQDMALAMAELTREQVLSQTGARAFSMFNKISSDHVQGLLQ